MHMYVLSEAKNAVTIYEFPSMRAGSVADCC